MSTNIENTIPILGVSDLDRSIEFYTQTLGFETDWQDMTLCSVSRDGQAIMLSSRVEDNNSNSWVWIGLHNTELIEELATKTIDISQPPTSSPWAYEMKILDPDGNTLWFAAPPRKMEDEPQND